MSHADPRLIDELCLQMRQYADTLEKLIEGKKCRTADITFKIMEVVIETRKQLTDLLSVKNQAGPDNGGTAVISDLAARYAELEGSLKEIRNDLEGRTAARAQAQEPLQNPGRDGKNRN